MTVPLGSLAAFALKLPVITVYLFICPDEIISLPAKYRNYKKTNGSRTLHKEETICA